MELQDSIFSLGIASTEFYFYQIGSSLSKMLSKESDPMNLYQTKFWLQPLSQKHQRKVYGFLDLIGDLGGVTEVILLVFGFFLLPFSEYKFNLKAV